VGLVARHAEAAGIPTLCMTSARDITRAVNPPRASFLDFPLGHTTGKPHEPDLQRQILVEALSSFETMTAPGSMKELPFRWSEDEEWKRRRSKGTTGRPATTPRSTRTRRTAAGRNKGVPPPAPSADPDPRRREDRHLLKRTFGWHSWQAPLTFLFVFMWQFLHL
jgi:hypothetical protein